mmetsp:Transcript_25506/g.61327  ORF Transcript_25506/g.61327 Transcript_25506/m.61327 type:complete len:397 (-) Transcript_25506:312-1502(-)
MHGEVRMATNFIQGRPHLGICLEHGADELPGILGHLAVRKAVVVRQYPAISALDVLALVGRLAHEHREADDSHAPHVHFEGVTPLLLVALDDFWGNVVGRPADGLALLVGGVDATRQAKVSDLDVHGLGEEEVAELEVSVDNVAIVHEAHGLHYLVHEEARLLFCERLPAFDHLVDALVVAELKEDVAVDLVLEEVLVLADVGVLHRSMDLDFSLKLLPGPALDQIGLRTNLNGVLLVRVQAGHLVHLREASLPQQLAPQILVDGVPVAARTLPMLHDRDRFGGSSGGGFRLGDRGGRLGDIGLWNVPAIRRGQRFLLGTCARHHHHPLRLRTTVVVRRRGSVRDGPSQHVAVHAAEALVSGSASTGPGRDLASRRASRGARLGGGAVRPLEDGIG